MESSTLLTAITVVNVLTLIGVGVIHSKINERVSLMTQSNAVLHGVLLGLSTRGKSPEAVKAEVEAAHGVR